jgi:hypothetical protein
MGRPKTVCPPFGGQILYGKYVQSVPESWSWEHMIRETAPDTIINSHVLKAGHLFRRPASTRFKVAYLSYGTGTRSSDAIKFALENGWSEATAYHVCADLMSQKDPLAVRFIFSRGGIMTTIGESYRTDLDDKNYVYACCFGWSRRSACKGSLWGLDQMFGMQTWFAFVTEPWKYAS